MAHLADGVYSELIAVPCGARYTMPLGVLGGRRPLFRVYQGTGLYSILRGAARTLYLLAPRDPVAYWMSIEHTLEDLIQWKGCPAPDPGMGAWYKCIPTLARSEAGYDVYECRGLEHVAGSPPAYTRAHGCLVELMVVYTKLRAGVRMEGVGEYARWLEWCVTRSAPMRDDLTALASKLRGLVEDLTSSGPPPGGGSTR